MVKLGNVTPTWIRAGSSRRARRPATGSPSFSLRRASDNFRTERIRDGWSWRVGRSVTVKLVFQPADPATAYPFVACVHWPRSGHHLLVRLLGAILGERFGYCSFYGHQHDKRCCGSFPCTTPGISFAKQHDIGFNWPVPKDGRPLLVQYRRFDEAVLSSFEVRLSQNLLSDTAEDFRALAVEHAKTYRRFVAKWVERDIPNRHVLRYNDLIERPHETMVAVLALFGAEDHADRIEAAVASVDHVTRKGGGHVIQRSRGVVNESNVHSFRFYDEAFFARLARLSSTRASREALPEAPARKRKLRPVSSEPT